MIKPASRHLNRIVRALSLGCMLLILISCGRSVHSDKEELVFRYNEHANINTLDPAFSRTLQDTWVANQLFNGLVQMDSDLNIIPSIAKKWTISDDGVIYTFSLRDDVYFHKHELFGNDSTRRVVAGDFEYSLNRLRDPKVAAPGRWVLNKVNDFKAINDTLFEIRLKQQFPAFIGLLSMKYCSVVPKEITEHFGSDFRSNPIGTGPFKFKRWEENIKLVFRKNHDYLRKTRRGTNYLILRPLPLHFCPISRASFCNLPRATSIFKQHGCVL